MKYHYLLISLMWLPAFGHSAESIADNNYGPLKTYTQTPFRTNSLSPQLQSSFPKSKNDVELYINGTAASVWAVNSDYELDYYQNQIAFGGLWQATPDWKFGLNYRWNYAGNNHIDGLTISFHDLVGLSQNGRDDVENDRFVMDLPDYGIEQRDFRGKTLSQAITAYGQYLLFANQNHAFSIGTSLYYNHFDASLFQSNDVEFGTQLNYSYRHGAHHADFMLSATHHNHQKQYQNLPFRKNAWSSGASYQYDFTVRHQLIVQGMIYQGLSYADDEFSKLAIEWVLGYRYNMQHSALEVSMIENMFNADNSTDIAFTLGYRYRLGN
ncbi:DUF3187 family protein [Vibrio olivae]